MKYRFLVDVNLPKQFSFFNSPNFIHVTDINPTMSDTDIWDLAYRNNYVILTKDADFYTRVLIAEEKPKIVYFQLGNQTLKGLHSYFRKYWKKIIQLLPTSHLIIAKPSGLTIVI